MVDEARVLGRGEGCVAGGDEVVGAVGHQDGEAGRRTVAVAGHADDGVVDDRRHLVVEAGLPDQEPQLVVLPVTRMIQSSAADSTLRKCGWPSITSRSNVAPDLASDGAHRACVVEAPATSSSIGGSDPWSGRAITAFARSVGSA